MLRERLILGLSMAAAIIGLLVFDAWLSMREPPFWYVRLGPLAIDVAPWLCTGLPTTLILLAFTWFTTRELTQFAVLLGHEPQGRLARVFACGLVVGPYIAYQLKPFFGWYDESWGLFWMAMSVGLAFLLQARRSGTERAMANISTTVFIIFYAGLAGFMTKLRIEIGGYAGVAALLYSVFLVKITDTGAFFTGRLFGRHKLIPWLSPKKTWEGFFGGIIVAIGCAVGIGVLLRNAGFEPFQEGLMSKTAGMAIFGLLMALISVAGDLCASLLKRDAAVKDSGQLPGLGGVLDVLDSPLLAAPAAWFFWLKVAPLVRM